MPGVGNNFDVHEFAFGVFLACGPKCQVDFFDALADGLSFSVVVTLWVVQEVFGGHKGHNVRVSLLANSLEFGRPVLQSSLQLLYSLLQSRNPLD
jgi:hypothetical protein